MRWLARRSARRRGAPVDQCLHDANHYLQAQTTSGPAEQARTIVMIDCVLTQFGRAAQMLWKWGVQRSAGRTVNVACPQKVEESIPCQADHPTTPFGGALCQGAALPTSRHCCGSNDTFPGKAKEPQHDVPPEKSNEKSACGIRGKKPRWTDNVQGHSCRRKGKSVLKIAPRNRTVLQ